MSRKLHPVLSNLQTLLRQENDIGDPSQLATHLLKKVEVAITALSTTPSLRGLALETLLNAFKFFFTHKHSLPNPSLETALVNGCSQLSSLVAHSPEGWGSMILQWSIRVLACLSSLNTSSSSFSSSPYEKVQYWMEQPLVKQLVRFVTAGIRHSSQDSHNDEEKEDGENCVQYLLAITNEGESDLSWLLAHIIAQQPSRLVSVLLSQACSSQLTANTTLIVAHTLELLASGHQDIIRQAILQVVDQVVSHPEEAWSGEKLRLLLYVGLHSKPVLRLVTKDVLQIMTAQTVYSLVCAEVDRKVEEKGNGDDGEVDSDGELMDLDKPHLSVFHGKSTVDNIVTLLQQLDGDEAVEVLHTIMECVPLCSAAHEEGMEDGEISSTAIAQSQLLERTRQLMSQLLQKMRSASSQLLLSSAHQRQHDEEEGLGVLMQFCVSLQPGLQHWAQRLVQADTDDSVSKWLWELVQCVSLCGPELKAASTIAFLLGHSDTSKLSKVVSLLKNLQLRHPGIISSALSQAIASSQSSSCRKLCSILLALLQDSTTKSLFYEDTVLCFHSLLFLLSSSSPSMLLDILLLVCEEFTARSSLADCLVVSEQLMQHFMEQLKLSAQKLMEGGSVDWEQEELTHKLRRLIFMICGSHRSNLVSVCSSIVAAVLSKETCGYLINAKTKIIIASQEERRGRLQQVGEFLGRQHGSSLQTRHYNESPGLSQVAVTHSSMHLLWLASDVVSQSSSTSSLGSALMDAAAPHFTMPLTSWPEEIDTSSITGQHSLEISLSVKRQLDQHPILWQFLSLVSTDTQGFLLCGGLVASMLAVMASHWQKGRQKAASSFPSELYTSEQLVSILAKVCWLPIPLCYVGELFEHLLCEEVFLLMGACQKCIKENYQLILNGGKLCSTTDETQVLIKTILRKHIDVLSVYYCRFVSCTL